MDNINEIEKKILKFWTKNKIFEKSLKKTKNKKVESLKNKNT